jgi:LacI family transcriptional regulator
LATIRDVAREAGVSTATVSRIFNGSTRVSEDARLRVWAAASALDYWPNEAARSLTTSRTQTLGVLLPDLHGEFFSEVLRGIDHAAQREQSHILFSISHADTDTLLTMARAMQGRTDGLIVMAPDEPSAAAIERIRTRFPIVLLNPRFRFEGCCSVSIANREGAQAVVDHLLRTGHRRIAIITGPAGNVDADERLHGYHAALEGAGLEPDLTLEFPGDFTESSGFRAAADMLRHPPLPSAVFAANDYMALGFMSALGQAGIRIPEDVALAGFDDIEISRYLSPPLTTAHVDARQLGARAVRLLISNMRTAGSAVPSHEVLPATLVVRSSCESPAMRRERRSRDAKAVPEGPPAPSPTSVRPIRKKNGKGTSIPTQEEAQP